MSNQLQKIYSLFKINNIHHARICFEQANWLSSDGKVKEYLHVHIQHDDLPDLNIGIGDSSWERLKEKVMEILIPEVLGQLAEAKTYHLIK